jgi:hypothetical protein
LEGKVGDKDTMHCVDDAADGDDDGKIRDWS